jgi:hypothetical protein
MVSNAVKAIKIKIVLAIIFSGRLLKPTQRCNNTGVAGGSPDLNLDLGMGSADAQSADAQSADAQSADAQSADAQSAHTQGAAAHNTANAYDHLAKNYRHLSLTEPIN